MKRALIPVGLFLVAVITALWFLGLLPFGGGAPGGATVPEAPSMNPAPPSPDVPLESPEPLVAPPAEVPDIVSPVRVLVLSDTPRSFVVWLGQAWAIAPRIEWQGWFFEHPEGAVTQAKGMPALEAAPVAADLDAYHVLAVCALDPAKLPPEFWSRVADRVRDGRLGLLVVPDFQGGYPLATEPSLRAVLPVATVLPPRATAPGDGRSPASIPGVLSSNRPFVVTTEGTRHPASRLVSFTGWSEKLWGTFTHGKTAWSTPYVAPVKEVAAGASVLVRVEQGDTSWPALVASSGESGRAIWAGGLLDLNWDTYRTEFGHDYLRAMVISWIAWLAPPR